MIETSDDDFHRMPGLYRLWDLQFVIRRGDDLQVRYAELTEDGTPLFSVYRRDLLAERCHPGVLQ